MRLQEILAIQEKHQDASDLCKPITKSSKVENGKILEQVKAITKTSHDLKKKFLWLRLNMMMKTQIKLQLILIQIYLLQMQDSTKLI